MSQNSEILRIVAASVAVCLGASLAWAASNDPYPFPGGGTPGTAKTRAECNTATHNIDCITCCAHFTDPFTTKRAECDVSCSSVPQ